LPYLDLFIAEKHNLPVSYFNPLHNVNLSSALNIPQLQQNNCYTGELVGLALRETGSCPAEITLDAPTLVARADKQRKQPYFFAALAAWVLLFVCLGFYYWKQTDLVNQTTAILRDRTTGLQAMAPQVEKLAKESDSLQRTLNDIVSLGKQRNAWPEILTALNNKIPEGVWITELTPYYDPSRGGSGGRGPGNGPGTSPGGGGRSPASGFQVPTTEVNLLVINGLYHAHDKTQQVDSARLSDFVTSLSELPYFDIDTRKVSETLISFTTSQTDPTSFAQKFSLRLKLKQPISLQP
jgi:type IV pilus assembly protein PilM